MIKASDLKSNTRSEMSILLTDLKPLLLAAARAGHMTYTLKEKEYFNIYHGLYEQGKYKSKVYHRLEKLGYELTPGVGWHNKVNFAYINISWVNA